MECLSAITGIPKGYRYTIVNDRPVIVEPRSRRIVEVIE
jgi:hypothetical protein